MNGKEKKHAWIFQTIVILNIVIDMEKVREQQEEEGGKKVRYGFVVIKRLIIIITL